MSTFNASEVASDLLGEINEAVSKCSIEEAVVCLETLSSDLQMLIDGLREYMQRSEK